MDELNFDPDDELGAIILLDKPLGWTSFDAVKKTRAAGRFKKIGHAGTLDPLASGLLICCTGKKTKQIEGIQAAEKVYEAEFTLGGTTASYDLEAEIFSTPDAFPPTLEQLQSAISQLTGPLQQVPPTFSAVKVNGTRAYTHARKGNDIELAAKSITVYEFELLSYAYPVVKTRIRCSKGTYIRSLARDLGEMLGTGAYLSALRRTRIGDFNVENAWPVTKLAHLLRQRREALAQAASQGNSDNPAKP